MIFDSLFRRRRSKEGGKNKEEIQSGENKFELSDFLLLNSNASVSLYLGGKRLEIKASKTGEEILVFDPDKNVEVPIKKGSSIIIGRKGDPEVIKNFNLPLTVSRKHCRIEYNKNGVIKIADLNSTNGTEIEISGIELRSYKLIEDIVAFFRFVEKNRGKEHLIDDSFYYFIVNIAEPENAYNENDPLIEEYISKIEKLKESMKNKDGIVVFGSYGWFVVNINGGPSSENIGRLYLNLKAENLPDLFEEVATTFQKKGLHAQMKIPEGSRHEKEKPRVKKRLAKQLRRTDKLVIYFNDHEEEKVLEVIEEFYRRYSHLFETHISRFALPVVDREGKVMKGIGFGEEPIGGIGGPRMSFGEVRAYILYELYEAYKKAKSQNLRFEARQAFEKICKEHSVDPENPAFNLRQDEKTTFKELRERSKLSKFSIELKARSF